MPSVHLLWFFHSWSEFGCHILYKVLEGFTESFIIRNSYIAFADGLVVFVAVVVVFGVLVLTFILLMTHARYLQIVKALWTCICSSSNRSWLEQISLALCSNELITLCKRYGIQVHFKSGKTIKDELMAPKDKDHITKKSGIIYRYKCDRLECDEEYIGETARTFGERFKKHLKAPSPIYDHSNITGHSTTLDNFSIVGREEQNLSRQIKESMFIRVNSPSLNRNIGKYHLPHIWDEGLVNNTELKLK